MIVQNTSKGYKIYGYDIINPYFKTYKPFRNSSSRTVRVGGKDISPGGYQPGLMYHKDEVVNMKEVFINVQHHPYIIKSIHPRLKILERN